MGVDRTPAQNKARLRQVALAAGYEETSFGWKPRGRGEVSVSRTMFEGLVLTNVHHWEDCQLGPSGDRPCVIHRPTPHHMRLWPLSWRDDRKIFERLCEHRTGHPDPDQFPFWESTGSMAEAVHGCDGCCSQGPLMRSGHVAGS